MIKSKRKKKRLTQLQLAVRIGVHEGYMNKLENHPEQCNPTVKRILKLAKELEIDPVKLFIYFVNCRKGQDN